MIIRPLTEKDLVFIAGEKKNFPDGWNYGMLLSSFNSGRFFGLIAEENGEPIAFITYSVVFFDADIESVYVRKEYRKKGVAAALMSAATDELNNKGVKKIMLEVRESNAPAIGLYLKFGFERISTRKKYYGDENAAVFCKEILI